MRNLKKILALVLALIMSLSLMATASATDFKDDESIDSYQLAIEVLSGLKVFGGDQNGNFNPKDPIRRSEVAAIIYRIATGDVTNDHSASYGLYNQFTDVQDGDWFVGYVSYCHNAGYIKGHGDGSFKPYDNVTGYQALAMILRAVGYDKNNEFTGDNWQINTASIATQRGVLKGLKSTEDLKADASRELVAEILFRSILLNKVEYNAITRGYTESSAKVCDVLGLKEITGVVTGNEYADLENDTAAMAAKTTRLETEKDGKLTLNVTSYLSDIGEKRTAYVVPGDKRTYDMVVDELYDNDYNNVKDNEFNKKNASDLAKDIGITIDNDVTEYYTNFDKAKEYTADIRIAYFVDETRINNTTYQDYYTYLSKLAAVTGAANQCERRTLRITTTQGTPDTMTGFYRWIPAGQKLTDEDVAIIHLIFNTADLMKTGTTTTTTLPNGTVINNVLNEVVRGEVYVGTQSTVDYSDTKSEKQFYEENTTESDARVASAENGEYLKVIDNDLDGIAEYVLKTKYILDEVISVRKDTPYYRGIPSSGKVSYEANGGEVYGDTVELAVGDVILSTEEIDGRYYAEVVTPVEATINTVVYATPKVTTTEPQDYLQSGITNNTAMEQNIIYMGEKVAYNLFLDKGGHIRAYKLVNGNSYGLLTEMYTDRTNNGAFVTRYNWIAELMGAADASPAEYNVLNSYINGVENAFIDDSRNNWTGWDNNLNYRDYLQQAIGHLGYNRTANGDNPAAANRPQEFTWVSKADNTTPLQSWTNVARYNKTDDGVYLYSASELAYTPTHEQVYYASTDMNGAHTWESLYKETWRKNNPTAAAGAENTAWTTFLATAIPVYAIDYVQMDAAQSIAAGSRMYNDPNGNRDVVYAVNDTQYYLVTQSGVRTFTGYANVPAIAARDIRAIYAVAQNTSATSADKDYWVADVIVIELNNDYNYESISLIYNNPSQTTNQTRALQTLNNKTAGVNLNVYPEGYVWGNQWGAPGESNYGFYGLTGTTANGENTVNAKVNRIQDHYNNNGIFAGTVVAVSRISNRGYYISVDQDGDNRADATLTVYTTSGDQVPVYAIGKNSSDWGYSATQMVIDPEFRIPNHVREKDQIIWVMNGTELAYIVDLTYASRPATSTWTVAPWLVTEWRNIDLEQRSGITSITPAYKFYGYGVDLVNENHANAKNDNTATFTFPNGVYVKNVAVKRNNVVMNPIARAANDIFYRLNAAKNEVTFELGAPVNATVVWDFTITLDVDGKTVIYTEELTQVGGSTTDKVNQDTTGIEAAAIALRDVYAAWNADKTNPAKKTAAYKAAVDYKAYLDAGASAIAGVTTQYDAVKGWATTAAKAVSTDATTLKTAETILKAVGSDSAYIAELIDDDAWGQGSVPGKEKYTTYVANAKAIEPAYDAAKALIKAYDDYKKAITAAETAEATTAYQTAYNAVNALPAANKALVTGGNDALEGSPTTPKAAYDGGSTDNIIVVPAPDALPDPVVNADGSKTITLEKDLELSAGLTQMFTGDTSAETITLDLNGYDVTIDRQTALSFGNGTSNKTIVLANSGNGESVIATTKPSGTAVNMIQFGGTSSSNKVVIEKGVTLQGNGANQCGVMIGANADSNTVEIRGKIEGFRMGATVNGNNDGGCQIIIEGAVIDTTGVGLYLAGDATTSIKNSQITSATSCGIEIRAGRLNITGGTITGSSGFSTPSANGNGTTCDGAGLAVSTHTTNKEITVNANGTTFGGYYGVYATSVQGSTAAASVSLTNIPASSGAIQNDSTNVSFIVDGDATKYPPKTVEDGGQ